MSLTVLRPGLLTTVQDLGRPARRLGVPPSGVLDPFAARIANRSVGNDDGAAVLECLLRGPALRAERPVTVAVVGAPVPVTVDGSAVAMGRAVAVPAGAVVDVGAIREGARCWLAIAGGVDVPPVLGSRSTDTLGSLGPAPLREGDVLPVGRAQVTGRRGLGEAAAGWPTPVGPDGVAVRAVRGPHADRLDGPVQGSWTVSPRSDRTGLRLDGRPARVRDGGEVASHGLVAGAVQVPPDGRPVVLLAGHQATGGYPVVAVVCAADLPLLAQARPGSTVRIRTVEVPAARRAYAQRVRELLGD